MSDNSPYRYHDDGDDVDDEFQYRDKSIGDDVGNGDAVSLELGEQRSEVVPYLGGYFLYVGCYLADGVTETLEDARGKRLLCHSD